VDIIFTACFRSNVQAPFKSFHIQLRSSSSTASATGEKPEMIVECIGNKANGMAELRRLLQKQFNSNSQERSPSYNIVSPVMKSPVSSP